MDVSEDGSTLLFKYMTEKNQSVPSGTNYWFEGSYQSFKYDLETNSDRPQGMMETAGEEYQAIRSLLTEAFPRTEKRYC